MYFWTILLVALATIRASNTKRPREEDSPESEPNKKLKTDDASFNTVTLPTEMWQLISDKVEHGSLPSLAGVNYTLTAVSRSSASLILGTTGSFTTDQFITLLPLVLQHLTVSKLPAAQVVSRFVAFLATATTKGQVYKIMMCWRACYGTLSDHILFDSLVRFMWKNETVLKHEMIDNEKLFYTDSRYQFFYPMALLASSFRKARVIWITFAAHVIGNNSTDESGSLFVRDIFDTLDEVVQVRTLEMIATAYVLGEERSTHDEDGSLSYVIGTLENAIGKKLPAISIDQVISKLDATSQDDFDEMLAALKFPIKLFYAESIFKNHPTVLEYRQRTEDLGKKLCSQPISNIQEYARMSPVQWRLLKTLISTQSHEELAGRLWRCDSFEKMAICFFALPVYNMPQMSVSLPRFLDADWKKHVVEIFNAAHWEALRYFYRDYVDELVWHRIEADLVKLVNLHLEDTELISCYNEALKIPECQMFFEHRLEICRAELIREFNGDVSGLDAVTNVLVQILPDHATIFQ